MATKLDEARKIINEVDAQMAELFVKRMRAAEAVYEYKKELGLPILDQKREDAVIEKNFIPRLHFFANTLVRHANARLVALDVFRRKGKSISVVQGDFPIFKGFNTEFRALGIEEYRERELLFLTNFFNQSNFLCKILV